MANGHHNQSISGLFWLQMCSNEGILIITEKQMVMVTVFLQLTLQSQDTYFSAK